MPARATTDHGPRTTDHGLPGRRPPKRQRRALYQPGPSAQDHHRIEIIRAKGPRHATLSRLRPNHSVSLSPSLVDGKVVQSPPNASKDKAAAERRPTLARIFKCGFRPARAIRPTGAADRIFPPFHKPPPSTVPPGRNPLCHREPAFENAGYCHRFRWNQPTPPTPTPIPAPWWCSG
jgi:hypothetical protein